MIAVSYTHLDVYKRQRKESGSREWKARCKRGTSHFGKSGWQWEAVMRSEIKLRLSLIHILGINTDAVCTIMRADGTVLGRRFIDHPSEEDRMYRTLGRIRRSQREHGSAQTQGR